MPAVLTANQLCKQFITGTTVHHALRDVNLAVFPGETVMLMGPSGSGKTTLLSILGGILSPTSGSVSVNGATLSRLSSKEQSALRLRHIGFIFQEYNLFPSLSALQNVQVALALRGQHGRKARRAALQQLASVGLEDKRASYPANLSGGQKQRLAIARALAGNPTLLLADEPTAALDSQNGTTIMHLLRDLARSGDRAVVVVTHDNRIEHYADRILHMEDGRLFEHAPPEPPASAGGGDAAYPGEQTLRHPASEKTGHEMSATTATVLPEKTETETDGMHTPHPMTASLSERKGNA